MQKGCVKNLRQTVRYSIPPRYRSDRPSHGKAFKYDAKNLSLVLQQLRGAFSLLPLTPEEMVGVRDPHGFRPLSLGRLKDGYVMASETCALDQVGAGIYSGYQSGRSSLCWKRDSE